MPSRSSGSRPERSRFQDSSGFSDFQMVSHSPESVRRWSSSPSARSMYSRRLTIEIAAMRTFVGNEIFAQGWASMSVCNAKGIVLISGSRNFRRPSCGVCGVLVLIVAVAWGPMSVPYLAGSAETAAKNSSRESGKRPRMSSLPPIFPAVSGLLIEKTT